MGTERGQSTEESKKTSTQKTRTYVHEPDICIIPGTTTTTTTTVIIVVPVTAVVVVCSKERTAPHDTAPQNEGQGCAAELYIYYIAELN